MNVDNKVFNVYLVFFSSSHDNGDKSRLWLCVLVSTRYKEELAWKFWSSMAAWTSVVTRASSMSRSLSQFAVDQDKFDAVWHLRSISEAPKCSRKWFKTVKPNITQVSLSVPALPSGKMAAKSCGRQCYGQVSQLYGLVMVSTVFHLVNVLSVSSPQWF